MRSLLATALLAAILPHAAFAQQPQPRPVQPPAAQQPPTISEKASRWMDRVIGSPQADANTDMRRLLSTLTGLGGKAIESLSPEEARQQPTPTDAVNALLRQEGKDPAQIQAAMNVKTVDVTYPAGAGSQTIRVYTPAQAQQPAPVIVYYHGGGWVIADLDTYDSSPRVMAQLTGAVVFSVEYRRAPEAKFPAQHEDAVAAYKWVIENAANHGGDPKRVAVMGESAGGNLAINVAIAARDQNLMKPVHQVLIYPVAGVDLTTPSYHQNETAQPLHKEMMAWFFTQLLRTPADKDDPRLDLVGKAKLDGLPPATVITAQIDPLQSEGQQLATKLEQAGVPTAQRNFEGVTHEFFGMGSVVAAAKTAENFVSERLKQAFAGAGDAAVTGTSTGQAGNK